MTRIALPAHTGRMLEALGVALVGVAVGVLLAWLVLSGVLAMAFRRARMIVRRIRDRRAAPRPDNVDRRQAERRHDGPPGATAPPGP